MIFKGRERELILRYIFKRKLDSCDGKFIIREKITAAQESKIEYENMSNCDKLNMYRRIVDMKIRDYIYDELKNRSMFMYFVNGCPKKRSMRLMEYASYARRSMSEESKKKVCKEIGIKYL